MANIKKLKILLFGPIREAESESLFLEKLVAAHQSKAGPFDVVFCVGQSHWPWRLVGSESAEHPSLSRPEQQNGAAPTSSLPVPVYLHDIHLETPSTSVGSMELSSGDRSDNHHSTGAVEQPQQLARNLFVLHTHTAMRGINGPLRQGVWRLRIHPDKPELVVASCPRNVRVDAPDTQQHLLTHFNHVSYTGCDFLFSHEWPQGIETYLPANANDERNWLRSDKSVAFSPLSFDVAHVALQARARYHVSPSNFFVQSAPFEHLSALHSSFTPRHVGRFLTLSPVQKHPHASVETGSGSSRNNNITKFVHAVGIVPLHSMSSIELEEQRASTVGLRPSPFTDAAYEMESGGKSSSTSTTANSAIAAPTSRTSATHSGIGQGGLSEASARRILNQENQKDRMPQRWLQKRSHAQSEGNHLFEVDPSCTSLFVYGLHQDVSGRLQQSQPGDKMLLEYFAPMGAQRIRRPVQHATTSFCFVEFETHDQAARCLERTVGQAEVQGVALQVKWRSSSTPSSHKPQEASKKQRLTEVEAKDSSTLYFKLPNSIVDIKTAADALRKVMEQTLEDALAGDDGDRVSAQDEPALQVVLRVPIATGETVAHFGFMDFASHAAASMALATLTGSTDGGRLLDEIKRLPMPEFKEGLYLHWARPDVKSKTSDDCEKNVIVDPSGFCFERKHFPPDARKDCWFCLASESCEKHLITAVYDTCYVTMPKGAVHKGHVLLVPVKHDSAGALKDSAMTNEMEEIKEKLRQHASASYNMDLFVFERAMETKRGYHTHVQCIPIERNSAMKVQATMLAQAAKAGFRLSELNTDLSLRTILDADNNEGYFYAEISTSSTGIKRFIYKDDALGKPLVPLQFGREVLAAVLGQPELAHWKSCVASRDEESRMASLFRDSFAAYCE